MSMIKTFQLNMTQTDTTALNPVISPEAEGGEILPHLCMSVL